MPVWKFHPDGDAVCKIHHPTPLFLSQCSPKDNPKWNSLAMTVTPKADSSSRVAFAFNSSSARVGFGEPIHHTCWIFFDSVWVLCRQAQLLWGHACNSSVRPWEHRSTALTPSSEAYFFLLCVNQFHQTRACSLTPIFIEAKVLKLFEWGITNQWIMSKNCLASISFKLSSSQLFMSQTYISALLEKGHVGMLPLDPIPNHLYVCTCTKSQ